MKPSLRISTSGTEHPRVLYTRERPLAGRHQAPGRQVSACRGSLPFLRQHDFGMESDV
jgi:hypothetical protein